MRKKQENHAPVFVLGFLIIGMAGIALAVFVNQPNNKLKSLAEETKIRREAKEVARQVASPIASTNPQRVPTDPQRVPEPEFGKGNTIQEYIPKIAATYTPEELARFDKERKAELKDLEVREEAKKAKWHKDHKASIARKMDPYRARLDQLGRFLIESDGDQKAYQDKAKATQDGKLTAIYDTFRFRFRTYRNMADIMDYGTPAETGSLENLIRIKAIEWAKKAQ